MSVSWQTGEPPCGVELLIEYVFLEEDGSADDVKCYNVVTLPLNKAMQLTMRILRWSTLDDDRAAKAMGALEKMLSDDPWPWFCLDTTMGSNMFEASRYTDDGESQKVEAPTLIEAIEKLTENGNGLQGD